MSKYFDDLARSAKKYPDFYEFVENSLHYSQKSELDALKGARSPEVRVMKNGLAFEFSTKEAMRVRLGDFGEVIVDDMPAAQASLRLDGWYVGALLAVDSARAAFALAGRLAIGAFRLITGNSLRVTAAGAGAGAALGCYAGAAMKHDYESYVQGCGNGSLDGALILSGVASLPYFNDRGEALLSKKSTLNPRVANSLKVFGVVGSVAAATFSAPALATMNG